MTIYEEIWSALSSLKADTIHGNISCFLRFDFASFFKKMFTSRVNETDQIQDTGSPLQTVYR